MTLTPNFFYKTALIYLNHMYFSFFFLILIVYLKTTINFWHVLIFIYFVYKLYFLEIQNIILLKAVFKLHIEYHFFFELIVGLVSFHPPLFYLGLFYWIFLFLFTTKNTHTNYINTKQNLIILSFALWLGGVWGWLNFSWGYIWVYDYIEYFLMWLVTYLILNLHKKNFKYFNKGYIWILGLLVIYYYSLRMSFLPTRHSFFSQVSPALYKQIIITLLILNHLNFICFYFFIKLWLKLKFLSLIFVYLIFLSFIFVVTCSHIMSFLTATVHIIVFCLIWIFSMHTTNYFFLQASSSYYYFKKYYTLNLNFSSFNKFYQLKYSNKLLIKKFKSNIFLNLQGIATQHIEKLQTYKQFIFEIMHFFILIFCIFFIKLLINDSHQLFKKS